MRPTGLLTEYLKASKIAIIVGDTLILHGAIHTYNMGYVYVYIDDSDNKMIIVQMISIFVIMMIRIMMIIMIVMMIIITITAIIIMIMITMIITH
jgi:hypothetical protein